MRKVGALNDRYFDVNFSVVRNNISLSCILSATIRTFRQVVSAGSRGMHLGTFGVNWGYQEEF